MSEANKQSVLGRNECAHFRDTFENEGGHYPYCKMGGKRPIRRYDTLTLEPVYVGTDERGQVVDCVRPYPPCDFDSATGKCTRTDEIKPSIRARLSLLCEKFGL